MQHMPKSEACDLPEHKYFCQCHASEACTGANRKERLQVQGDRLECTSNRAAQSTYCSLLVAPGGLYNFAKYSCSFLRAVMTSFSSILSRSCIINHSHKSAIITMGHM
eukprot:GHUV01042326.1.p1 GENE.GHUV01042326.1~~GHUV01042326.1.p1  ORF type:complete len:108 (-),score=6.20 GHUV01042326.1:185-508(-)